MPDFSNVNMGVSTREHGHGHRVTFPRMADQTSLVMLTALLEQSELSHDLLTIKLKGVLVGSNKLAAGDPVKFEWYNDGVKSTWIGHVYLIDNNTYTTSNVNVVTCIGNSYHLKQPHQEVYSNCTADMVARKIARRHGYKAEVVKHNLVFKQVSQSGQSDWQLLSRLAQQCGYALRVENSKLIFKPKEDLRKASRKHAQVFKYLPSYNGAYASYMTVYDFLPTMAEHVPELDGSGVERVLSYATQKGAESTQHAREYNKYNFSSGKAPRHARADNKAIFKKIVTTEVAPTSQYAKTVLKSMTNDKVYRYKATARLLGSPRVRPYQSIYLDGIPDGMHGYWTVISVKHIFGETRPYYLEVVLGTDTLGESLERTATSNTRDIQGELEGTTEAPIEDDYTFSAPSEGIFFISNVTTPAEVGSVEYSTSMYTYTTPDMSEIKTLEVWRPLE